MHVGSGGSSPVIWTGSWRRRSSEIAIDENGNVIDKATGQAIAGVSATSIADLPPEALASAGGALARLAGNVADLTETSGVEFLAGGNSKDGVAEVSEIPVLD